MGVFRFLQYFVKITKKILSYKPYNFPLCFPALVFCFFVVSLLKDKNQKLQKGGKAMKNRIDSIHMCDNRILDDRYVAKIFEEYKEHSAKFIRLNNKFKNLFAMVEKLADIYRNTVEYKEYEAIMDITRNIEARSRSRTTIPKAFYNIQGYRDLKNRGIGNKIGGYIHKNSRISSNATSNSNM